MTKKLETAWNDYEDEHEAFAASRSTDYIYETGSDETFDTLDRHSENIDRDAKLPLVITGAAGCGKSALLANWVNRRRQCKHREEFLFQHFVGCSPRSKQLAHLLFRLETALKEHYQLREMEVPNSEERLRWSLNRFLAAAAKKQHPARIVIVMDAVNCLRGESSAADTLHWLPTELPQGVRIIVATVELEHSGTSIDVYEEGLRFHRTLTELRRRKCPTIRLQPLSVEIRHLIISRFICTKEALPSLEQAQQFRLVTAKASSQPLFLRTILYALRLGVEMSDASIDMQIDVCLAARNASDLISAVLDMCTNYVESSMQVVSRKTYRRVPESSSTALEGSLAKIAAQNTLAYVLTAVYTSRHGLSDAEIWGIVELATSKSLESIQRNCIRRVLRDFTFSVNGLKNFSHQDYAAVVYTKYIRKPETNIREHHLLAHFFGKFPPCDRKLDALPYHLEVAGSWSRLKLALVDVRMFKLWWTAVHKTEFLNLWASLTACRVAAPTGRKLVTGEFNDSMKFNQPSRPCLDIVEEYVRSVDDFKYIHSPSDGDLSVVILKVADFMLEFATMSLEEAADVPRFSHPVLPSDDLASLGVPFISRDKDGNSLLNLPLPHNQGEPASRGAKHAAPHEMPMKANEEIPLCSTYFYHRWMWIQFPWVSLANCGEKLLHTTKWAAYLNNAPSLKSTTDSVHPQTHAARGQSLQPLPSGGPAEHRKCQDLVAMPHRCIPQSTKSRLLLKGEGRALSKSALDRHILQSAKSSSPDNSVARMESHCDEAEAVLSCPDARGQLLSSRLYLNSVRQNRETLDRTWSRVRHEVNDVKALEQSCCELAKMLGTLNRKLEQVRCGYTVTKLLYRNYECVKLMCERHPAQNLAVIIELESKIRQDTMFIDEVRNRLRKAHFELQCRVANRKVMERGTTSLIALQNEMLSNRIGRRHILLKQSLNRRDGCKNPRSEQCCQVQDGCATEQSSRSTGQSDRSRSLSNGSEIDRWNHITNPASEAALTRLTLRWDDYVDLMRRRTFINDVGEFFGKLQNALSLKVQMTALHDAAELRQRELKHVLTTVENELEQVRYDSQSVIGSNSREARELQTRLTHHLARCKHSVESALAAERLRQAAFFGVKHVCTSLGIPSPDQDTPVNEIIHQVENVLEALMEEKDKTMQKLGDSHQSSFRDNAHGYEKLPRVPELEAALEQFQTPKALVANRLPDRSECDENRNYLDAEVGIGGGDEGDV